jgi:hypothetical protein
MTTELVLADKRSSLISPESFDHVFRISQIFADSDLVPEHFKKKPQNVFIALQMAERLGLDAMLAIQNIHVIKGKPALSSQMLIGLINASGLIDGVISFTSNGKPPPDLSVTASAKLKGSEQIISATFAFSQAQAMGVTQNAPWKTAPELMCRYRAASHLARSYFPQLTLGLGNKEELEELEPLNVTPRTQTATIALTPRRESIASEAQQEAQTPQNEATITSTPKPRGRPPKAKMEIVAQESVKEAESDLYSETASDIRCEDVACEDVGF